MTAKEKWKPIPGFPDYEVSDHGRVRSYLARGKGVGNWYRAETPQRILVPGISSGYELVNLRNADNKTVTWRIHQLVMLAFVGPYPPDQEICHTNNDKTDNRLCNLRYDTAKNNMADLPAHPQACLSEEQVIEARKRRATGETTVSIAKDMNCSVAVMQAACAGKTYKEVDARPIRWGHGTPPKTIIDILKKRAAGKTLKEIASYHDMSESGISRICAGNRRANALDKI